MGGVGMWKPILSGFRFPHAENGSWAGVIRPPDMSQKDRPKGKGKKAKKMPALPLTIPARDAAKAQELAATVGGAGTPDHFLWRHSHDKIMVPVRYSSCPPPLHWNAAPIVPENVLKTF
jgi:hypothetical protein